MLLKLPYNGGATFINATYIESIDIPDPTNSSISTRITLNSGQVYNLSHEEAKAVVRELRDQGFHLIVEPEFARA